MQVYYSQSLISGRSQERVAIPHSTGTHILLGQASVARHVPSDHPELKNNLPRSHMQRSILRLAERIWRSSPTPCLSNYLCRTTIQSRYATKSTSPSVKHTSFAYAFVRARLWLSCPLSRATSDFTSRDTLLTRPRTAEVSGGLPVLALKIDNAQIWLQQSLR